MLNCLIYLGVSLLVLGLFGNYILQRIEDQNHKVVTLASIVTSITAELQTLKLCNKIETAKQQEQL